PTLTLRVSVPLRPPPRSTLFPTRRSSDLPAEGRSGQEAVDARADDPAVLRDRALGALVQLEGRAPSAADAPHPDLVAGHRDPAGDRKSTRLNSSHVAISYAVFCLKKKKYT